MNMFGRKDIGLKKDQDMSLCQAIGKKLMVAGLGFPDLGNRLV
jgi:hypothetical protein